MGKKKDKLIELLEEIKIELDKSPIYFTYWNKDKKGMKCLEIIQSINSYEVYDDAHEGNMSGSMAVNYMNLLDWLLKRTIQKNAKQAIKDLDKHLNKSSVRLEFVELIVDCYADCAYKFKNGVFFSSPHSLKDSELANSLISTGFNRVGSMPAVTAVLTKEFKQKLAVKKDPDQIKTSVDKPYQLLEDTRLLLSLVTSVEKGIHSIGHTISIPDNVPLISRGRAWNIKPFKRPNMGPSILEIDFNSTDNLLDKFSTLSPKNQESARIPLRKLNDFGTNESSIDRAISLRTCLEAIFLDDADNSQLRYKMGLRAAKLLGTDLDDRKVIAKKIKDAYDMSSTAVHTGNFSSSKSDFKILTETANYARKALIKRIDSSWKIDWTELELHG